MAKVTCDGRCCAVFPLPKDVRQRLENGANGKDAPFILDMLVPLTRRQAVARAKKFGFTLPWSRTRRGYFTCRHWDEETRLCTVYARRPAMCREYPYDRACDHPDCCYTASKKAQSKWRKIHKVAA